MIMTSNASEDFYAQIGYDAMLQRYQGSFNTFVGPTKILISSDTLQVKDYSRYNWTMFNPEHKQERHETVFPEDKKKAFALCLILDALLVALYCILWIVCWKKNGVFKALALSILPSAVFLISGITSRSILLILAALLFAPSHILISYQNAKNIREGDVL